MAALNHVGDPARAVVLLCHDVHTLDATALVALESALDEVARHPAVAVLAGMRPQPLALLREAAVLGRRGVFVCNDTERAMDVAARAARGELTPEEPRREAGESGVTAPSRCSGSTIRCSRAGGDRPGPGPSRRSRPSRTVIGCGGQPGIVEVHRDPGERRRRAVRTRPGSPRNTPPEIAQAPTAMTSRGAGTAS